MLFRLVIWPLFALPFLPFYLSWHLPFPFITGRTLLFRLLVEVAFFAWFSLLIVGRVDVHKVNNPLVWALALFLFTVKVANTLGLHPNRSFWSTWERLEGYILLLHVSALCLILLTVFTEREWRIYLGLFALSGLLVSLSTLLPIWPGGGVRSGGVFGNPAFLAHYLLLTGGVAVLACVRQRAGLARLLYAMVGGLQFGMATLTGSRAAIVAIACGMGVFGGLYLLRCGRREKTNGNTS